MAELREKIAKVVACCVLYKGQPVYHWDFTDMADQILTFIKEVIGESRLSDEEIKTVYRSCLVGGFLSSCKGFVIETAIAQAQLDAINKLLDER